jgi:hypothetical protein
MPISSFLTIALLLAGVLLSSCSHPSAPTDFTGTSEPELPMATSGTGMSRVDSLNGIPGHHFGEPLSAFPRLVLTKTQNPGTQTYSYPDDKPEAGWFGKHKKEVPSVFYVFRDGKFAAFQAIAFGMGRRALQQETVYLFGRGKTHVENTTWAGKKAQVIYTSTTLTRGPAEVLDVESIDLVNAQVAEEAARLKRENAGQ